MGLQEWPPPKTIDNPRGQWSSLANRRRGTPNHASATVNSRFSPGVASKRTGTSVIAPATGEVKGIFNWISPAGGNYVLYRDGSVIRSLLQPDTLSSILKPIGTMYRPSFAPLDVWTFFCGPDTAGAGTQQVRIYDGVNVDKAFRPAISLDSVTAADTGPGQCTAGTHYLALVYANRTGFSTVPVSADSSGTPYSITLGAGMRQVTIIVNVPPQIDGGTNPTGGQATLYLLVTRADSATNWYFLPAAVPPSTSVEQFPIPYNAAATATFIFDLADEDLAASADPANNQFLLLTQAADGTGPFLPQFVAVYGTRMCYGVGSKLYASNQNDAQTITETDNVVIMPNQRYIGFAFALPNGTSLYLGGDHWTAYATDNSDTPSTWSEPISVSDQLGAPGMNCICRETCGNYAWVVTEGGPYMFAGSYDPKPLTYLSADLWKRVNWTANYAIEIADDTVALRLYIAVPLDGATEPTHVIVIDYQNGTSFDTVDISLDNYDKPTFGGIGVVKEWATDGDNLWIGPSGPNQTVYPVTITVTDADGHQVQIQCVFDIACPFV